MEHPAGARALGRGIAAALAAVLLLVATHAADAHGRRTGTGPASGIAIPNLTHGQMAVMAAYRGEILDLAARQPHTDEPFRRVLNYANIQFSFCMWGLMPGSVSDEASPFNECSHAYLAATRSVLMRMDEMAGRHPAVDALVSRVDMDMIRNSAALVLCQFSDETFNTADVLRPDWSGVLSHPPSLAAIAFFALALGGGLAAARYSRRNSRRPG